MRGRLLIALLPLLICFSLLVGCAGGARASDTPEHTVPELAEQLEAELDAEHLPADDDFFDLNFSGAPTPEEYAIYLTISAPAGEYGVFQMRSRGDAEKMAAAIEEYLKRETSARASLAGLYPSETAAKELEHYQNAQCYRSGKLVCYFAGGERETGRIKALVIGEK